MRLKRFSVRGLFGLFNHEISFRLQERITIIHAPNGFGKTVILKLISALFAQSLAPYRKVDFSQILFEFDDGSSLAINQRKSDDKDIVNPVNHPRFYKLTYKQPGDEHTYVYDPWAKPTKETTRIFDVSRSEYLTEYVPFLSSFSLPFAIAAFKS
jgi:hypothetical protein